MTTIYLLYIIAGGGVLNHSWGGPALLRFESAPVCEAAASAMRARKYVTHAECVPVNWR